MFGGVNCLLCLESIDIPAHRIEIDSKEGQALDVQGVVGQYFKEQLSTSLSCTTTRTICQQCWKMVLIFHQFYLRIRAAHVALINTIHCSKDFEIKAETTVSDSSSAVEYCPTASVLGHREEPHQTSCENEIEIEQPVLLPTEGDLQLEDIKNEAGEFVEANYSTDGINSEHTESIQGSNSESGATVQLSTKKVLNAHKAPDVLIAQYFKLSCCLCDSPQDNFLQLQTHFETQHQTRGYALCCDKKLKTRRSLVDHIRVHQNPEYFKCAKCDKALSNRRCLAEHLKFHKLAANPKYKCDVCSKIFARKAYFMRHILIHVPEEQRTHTCPHCNKTFPDNLAMTVHIKCVHQNRHLKICDICGKSLRGRFDFQRHMDGHAGIELAPVSCKLCGAVLKTKYGLARHMAGMHSKGVLHKCHKCSRRFQSLSSCETHMERVHAMEPQHSCPICRKIFKKPRALKEHMASHTGEPLYTCDFCPRTFVAKSNMYTHRKRMHHKEWEQLRTQRESQTHTLQNLSETEAAKS